LLKLQYVKKEEIRVCVCVCEREREREREFYNFTKME
jgi:hypothetical protein